MNPKTSQARVNNDNAIFIQQQMYSDRESKQMAFADKQGASNMFAYTLPQTRNSFDGARKQHPSHPVSKMYYNQFTLGDKEEPAMHSGSRERRPPLAKSFIDKSRNDGASSISDGSLSNTHRDNMTRSMGYKPRPQIR